MKTASLKWRKLPVTAGNERSRLGCDIDRTSRPQLFIMELSPYHRAVNPVVVGLALFTFPQYARLRMLMTVFGYQIFPVGS